MKWLLALIPLLWAGVASAFPVVPWPGSSGGGGSGSGDIESVGDCATGACPGPIVFSGGSATLKADAFLGPAADVADAGAVRLGFGEQLCWEDGAGGGAVDLCVESANTDTVKISADTLWIAARVGSSTALFIDGPQILHAAADPIYLLDDSLPPADGTPETLFRGWSNADDNGSWLVGVESGAAGTYQTALMVNSTGGASTVYLGGNSTSQTPPTAAVTVNESGILNYLGTGEIQNAYPRCINLDADEITCLGTAGCAGDTLNGTGFSVVTAAYATDLDDTGTFHFVVPQGWTGVELTITVDWTSDDVLCDNSAAGTDTVSWLVDSGSMTDDGALLAPTFGGSAQTVTDICILTGDLMRATISNYVHGMTDGQRGILSVTRDVDTDAYLGFANLVGVRLCTE